MFIGGTRLLLNLRHAYYSPNISGILTSGFQPPGPHMELEMKPIHRRVRRRDTISSYNCSTSDYDISRTDTNRNGPDSMTGRIVHSLAETGAASNIGGRVEKVSFIARCDLSIMLTHHCRQRRSLGTSSESSTLLVQFEQYPRSIPVCEHLCRLRIWIARHKLRYGPCLCMRHEH